MNCGFNDVGNTWLFYDNVLISRLLLPHSHREI